MREVSPNEATTAARTPPVPQPLGARPSAADTVEWAEPLALETPRSRTPLIVALTASLLAVGAGYMAADQFRARQTAVTALTKTKSEVQALSQERSRITVSLNEHKTQLAEQKQRIELDESEKLDLETKLGAAEARLRELEAQSEEQAAYLAEFRGLTQKFQRMISSGKLEINFRRGRMIVELPAAVLFASGSAELSNDGRQALSEIAKILRKVPGKRFVVAGHTDDVPIAKGTSEFSSNWALSTARAVKVTESLIDAGLLANHLVAAGYGEYDPIASNATDKGRQKNRRIEIVLEPELGALPKAIAALNKDADANKTQAANKATSKTTAKATKTAKTKR